MLKSFLTLYTLYSVHQEVLVYHQKIPRIWLFTYITTAFIICLYYCSIPNRFFCFLCSYSFLSTSIEFLLSQFKNAKKGWLYSDCLPLRNPKTSTTVAPSYIPTNNVWDFQFLHILTNTYFPKGYKVECQNINLVFIEPILCALTFHWLT